MSTVGFLHTSPVHVVTFDELVAEVAPGRRVEHLVDETLLDRARDHGVSAVRSELREALADLADRSVDLIVCTCSTIGGLAEALASESVVGIPVVRVDRPMAELAVEAGPRIAVVAALESTIGPTTELIRDVAGDRGVEPDIDVFVVDGAWSRFESGDIEGYHALVAERLSAYATTSDVIVLAQASMAGAVDLVGDIGVPVLASPRVAVERLLAG